MLSDKVPAYVETVTIDVDDDEAGRRGAYELAQRLERRSLEVVMLAASADWSAAA